MFRFAGRAPRQPHLVTHHRDNRMVREAPPPPPPSPGARAAPPPTQPPLRGGAQRAPRPPPLRPPPAPAGPADPAHDRLQRPGQIIFRVEDRLFVFLQILVVPARQPFHRR